MTGSVVAWLAARGIHVMDRVSEGAERIRTFVQWAVGSASCLGQACLCACATPQLRLRPDARVAVSVWIVECEIVCCFALFSAGATWASGRQMAAADNELHGRCSQGDYCCELVQDSSKCNSGVTGTICRSLWHAEMGESFEPNREATEGRSGPSVGPLE
jgi:hypothetical protein